MTEESIFATIGTIAVLVRSVHLKRALTAVNKKPGLNFWRLIYGNSLDIAVLEWCKLFGSDHKQHQPFHWKNNVVDPKAFRRGLLKQLKIDKLAWTKYWTTMKAYRDTHVAHLNFKSPDEETYPNLELALESAYFYYNHLLPEWRRLGNNEFPDDIRDYCDRFAKQSKIIAEAALNGTSSIEECVF